MSYKLLSRIILSVLILSTMVFSAKEATKKYHEDIKYVVVANGKIQGKFESDYSCGSKGKYTCYSRFLIINNVEHKVNLDTFTKKRIGENVVLKVEKFEQPKFWEICVFILGIFFWVILFLLALYYLYSFIVWSAFYSDKETFHKFLN